MPTALKCNPWEGSGWRAVEAQHKNATLMLVSGNTADQALLESIIEQEKPPLPSTVEKLHWLLATPFRYSPPKPQGSRFCALTERASVFYGAEDEKTSCAEFGYWRLKMWMDSEGLRGKDITMQVTLFEFHAAAERMLDLTAPPYAKQMAKWTHSSDYTETQAMAAQARAQGIQAIRAVSVRNFPEGRCLIMLTPTVFQAVHRPFRNKMHTWNLYIAPPHHTVWTREFHRDLFEFTFLPSAIENVDFPMFAD
jgi:hypothetical protein